MNTQTSSDSENATHAWCEAAQQITSWSHVAWTSNNNQTNKYEEKTTRHIVSTISNQAL